LEKITILLELNKNVFIYPTYYNTKGGEKFYTGLYPLKPSEVIYKTNDKDEIYLTMRFANGYETTLPAENVIHWRKDYGVNDYFGGGMFGGDDNAGLLTMLERYDQLTQSIAKALEVSCNVTMALKVNTYSESEALKAKREEFEADIKANKSGILVTDLSSAIEKIPRDVKLVDAETLKFFYETILRANGTSLAILNGDYTKAQKEAYYEHALEADIKGLGQAMSRTLFTDREAAFGNEIVLYPNDITFMSMENKLTALQVGLPAGIFTKNEARALLGYAPIEGGDVMPRGYNEVDSTTGANDDNTTNEVNENE
jgi:HK97 family phage portal protein